MKLSLSLLALFSSVSVNAIRGPVNQPVTYDGVKVLRLAATTDAQVKFLDSLIDQLDLDTWKNSHRVNANVDVEVPAKKLVAFQDAISRAGITNVLVMHEDLGESIRQESGDSKKLAAAAVVADQSWFNAYHPYADHISFLNALVAKYPSNSKIVLSGNSTQGQPITGIHIYGSGGAGSKPAVIFHGTVHAREWISGMVNDYLAYSLLNNYANSTEVKGYVDKYDFYIFPHVNPDGFVYTQTTQRLWRKNRASNSGSTCVGQDINRNWPSHWEVTGGASTNPCADDYKGPSAGSAIENKSLVAFVNGLARSGAGAKLYVDWHSYSQLFMSPYGYSCSAKPADNTELVALAAGFGKAVQALYGTRFTTGPICTTIYQATGSSADYTYDVSKIKYSFAAELRDTGANSFVLPVNQIRPSGEEIFAGVKYLLANIK